jgi:NSS family neurotransmitter:Na+ symporter
MSQQTHFGSRLGMMLAMLGMAVGTGNIWRFPRIAGQNGGGEFLVAWVAFLFLWSIPLILVEFGMGRKMRSGPIKAFMGMMGPRWAWMGAFVVFVASAIMFYYSVVAGWTFRFTAAAITGEIPSGNPGEFWTTYSQSLWPALTHAMAIGTAVFVVARGVNFIERVAKILMPALIFLVIVLTIRAVTLPGAGDGLAYLFSVDWSQLGRAELWIAALTQNAWDTGAGWGLVLCYAAYLPPGEDTVQNAFILPAANNLISLTAGVMIMSTVFSVVPGLVANLQSNPEALAAYPSLVQAIESGAELTPELMRTTIFSQSNEGLTFVWMPQLFDSLPFGRMFMTVFFLALAFAAITSLISMVELATRALVDAGVNRGKAAQIVGGVAFMMGLPAVIWLPYLRNQDWVWGVGLMVTGLFFAIAVMTHGVKRFREEQLNHADSHWHIGRWWDVVITVLVPLQAVVLMVWWLYQARGWDPNWLAPFQEANVGTVLFQWAIAFALVLLLNRTIVRRVGDAG